ncbi:MAG: hypothetical protein WC514_02530 [Candidatus Paceibacterota bacterium]
MEKKQSANWNIAATYYLTAVFVPNILGRMVLNFLPILGITNTYLLFFINFVVISLIIWLGTMYAANYINGKYIINNKNGVIKSATMYFVVINIIGGTVLSIVRNSTVLDLIFSIVVYIILAFVFNFLSKKYIKSRENTNIQQNTL